MGHTNSTANLALPQFIGTDKPTWLGDVNGAFLAIDGYVGTNNAAVAAATSDASSAISQASAAVNTANTANTTAGNASTAANNAVGVANTANAIAGTVDAKVGLLADLNTTDRTSIVNAINEVFADTQGNDGSVATTSDGVKTTSQILDSLYALADTSKISAKSYIEVVGVIFRFTKVESGGYTFTAISSPNIQGLVIKTSGSTGYTFNMTNTTYTDSSSSVVSSGITYTLHY